jgi:hypothetical protein
MARHTRRVGGIKIGVAGLATAVALLGAACGEQVRSSSTEPAPVHLSTGATRLHALLAAARVPVGRGKSPAARSFPAAWKTFRRFARIPVAGPEPSGDEADDDLLFEFGVFESNFYGTSFEVELTRQFATASGDLEQVHLVVHFPVTTFIAITRSLRAMPCVPGDRCVFRCFFAGDDALVPHPCRVALRGTGYRVGDMTLRASQTGEGGVSAQRTHWIEGVESSPVFRALLTRQVRPDGYEVWEEPAA